MVCTRLRLVETSMNNVQTEVEQFTRKTISLGQWLRLLRHNDTVTSTSWQWPWVTSQSGIYKYVQTCTEDVLVCTWYKQVQTSMYLVHASMYQLVLRMYLYVLDTDQYILVCTWCVQVHTWMYHTASEPCFTGFLGALRDANTLVPDV